MKNIFEELVKTSKADEKTTKFQKTKSEFGVEVKWNGSYNDAKDDAEMYCGNCDEHIENDNFVYCPMSGVKLLIHGKDIF